MGETRSLGKAETLTAKRTPGSGCETQGLGVFASEEFELLEGARPIFPEKARKGAVGEELPSGLACGAIVGFVGGVTDALDFRVAARARLFVTAVDGHAFAKSGDVFGESAGSFGTQPVGPAGERVTRGREKALDFRRGKLLGERERGKFRREQNFIGIGIADAAEEAGVGEGTLERVVRREKNGGKARRIGVENFKAAGIESEKAGFSRDEMKRSALLRAGFGPEKRAGGKIEGSEAPRRRNLDAASSPVQAAGDHQVQDEPKAVLEADANALSEAPQPHDPLASGAGEQRGRGAQEKRTDDAGSFERLAGNALLKRFDVNDDVGQFGHWSSKLSVISYKLKR
jgi:hypothetical protein